MRHTIQALFLTLLLAGVGCHRKYADSPKVAAALKEARAGVDKCAATGDVNDCAAACENQINRDHEVMAPCQNACFAGRPLSCSSYGNRLLHIKSFREAIPFYEKGCTLNDVVSCAGLDHIMEDNVNLATTFDRAALDTILTSSCDAGESAGCYALGRRHMARFKKSGLRDDAESSLALPLMAKACNNIKRATDAGASGCAAYACLSGTGRTPSGVAMALHNACPAVGLPAPGVGRATAAARPAGGPGASAPQVDPYRQSVQRQEQQRLDNQARDNNYRVKPAGAR